MHLALILLFCAASTLTVSGQIRGTRRIADIQVALDRQLFSPGCIDDHIGPQTRAALRAWQAANKLPASGVLDDNTAAALKVDAPAFIRYEITTNDFAQLGVNPEGWRARSELDRMPFETMLELIAEKFHATERFIREINPQINWDTLNSPTNAVVPNVLTDEDPPKIGTTGRVRISLSQKWMTVLDSNGSVQSFFPCSIGRDKMKRPVGQLQIVAVAPHPNYTFDPRVFPESPEAQSIKTRLIIPPGPNNPVGDMWLSIGRSAGSEGPPLTGYGIHGTPKPEDIGKTESHGCFRLSNWNVARLGKMITVGTPVSVEE